MHQLKHVYPLVLSVFPKGDIRKFLLAGRLQYFLENWKILTNDPKILEWVYWFKNRLIGGNISRKSSTPGSSVNARV